MRQAGGPIGTGALAVVLAATLAMFAAGTHAQTPSITVDDTPCVPEADNGLITGRVQPEVGGTVPRLYFRWREHGTFYWVPMTPAGGGRYWAVLPKPEKSTQTVERYISVMNPGGRELGRSASAVIPVKSDCKVTLDAQQQGQAENLVVGETAMPQKGRGVLGFLCDGIVSRVDANGILRADEICRICIVPWEKKLAAIPLIPPIILCLNNQGCGHGPESSPSRP